MEGPASVGLCRHCWSFCPHSCLVTPASSSVLPRREAGVQLFPTQTPGTLPSTCASCVMKHASFTRAEPESQKVRHVRPPASSSAPGFSACVGCASVTPAFSPRSCLSARALGPVLSGRSLCPRGSSAPWKEADLVAAELPGAARQGVCLRRRPRQRFLVWLGWFENGNSGNVFFECLSGWWIRSRPRQLALLPSWVSVKRTHEKTFVTSEVIVLLLESLKPLGNTHSLLLSPLDMGVCRFSWPCVSVQT